MAAAARQETACSDESVYAVPAIFDPVSLLPPPPADEAAQRDLEAVRAAQQSRTPAQTAEAEANSVVDVFLFTAVLGPRFAPGNVPETTRFLQRVYRTSLPYLRATKDGWNRRRPFVVDPTLTPLQRSLASTRLRSAPAPAPRESLPPQVELPCTAPAADTSHISSYPSGHAFVGSMLAMLLAEMVPEQRAALCAFGREYGDARVTSGVHFPSDVEAGRILASLLIDMLQRDARFREDRRRARLELRKALAYEPQEPPQG
ncbi:MAG TPA: phosphatase PAP2 family protein [Steroidobacteraceae bacterium]|nr:phosphatase PAP2 family protein [Steroidobacteraceae bacterium]